MIVDLNERRRDQATLRKQRQRERDREAAARGEMPVTKEGRERASSYAGSRSVTKGVTKPVTGLWITHGLMVGAFLLLGFELYINATMAWSQGATERNRVAFLVGGGAVDLLEFFLLTVAWTLLRASRWLGSIIAVCFWFVCLVYSIYSSVGFAATNLTSATELRAERVTPSVEVAQRKADAIAKSKEDECKQRGPRCRALEAEEQKAITDLTAAWGRVAADANPQASKTAALIGWLSLAKLSADDIEKFWLLLLAIVPHLGGVAFWLARR